MLSDTESRGAGDQATASTECQENSPGFPDKDRALNSHPVSLDARRGCCWVGGK
jgi:hypothetical protein